MWGGPLGCLRRRHLVQLKRIWISRLHSGDLWSQMLRRVQSSQAVLTIEIGLNNLQVVLTKRMPECVVRTCSTAHLYDAAYINRIQYCA